MLSNISNTCIKDCDPVWVFGTSPEPCTAEWLVLDPEAECTEGS